MVEDLNGEGEVEFVGLVVDANARAGEGSDDGSWRGKDDGWRADIVGLGLGYG